MMYKAYLKQSGEGCDYTIGCAQTVITIQADSMEDAIKKVEAEIKESYCDERGLESCELYEVNQMVHIDVKGIYAEKEEEENAQERAEADEAERAEFLRLQKKYGNN